MGFLDYHFKFQTDLSMKKFIKLILIITFISPITAQNNRLTKAQIDSLPNTVENQFLKTYSKASNWNQYKMIKRVNFLSFQKNILDSVSVFKKTIVDKNALLTKKDSSISKLEANIKQLETSVDESKAKENSISLLGLQVKKQLYNSILWGIIGLLAFIMIFFIYKYKSNLSNTKESKNNLIELENEFESFRKKTIEKEQKLRRQLHDEMNKNRNN